MPASTKKVTTKIAKRAASLEKGIAKVKAANAAKRAKVAAKAKPAAKAPRKGTLSAKLAAAATPESKAAHEANIAAARKIAKAAAGPTGAKATILAMIETAGEKGVSAAQIAKKLGWPRAGGTISRAIKLASFKVAKARDADGVLRYSRA